MAHEQIKTKAPVVERRYHGSQVLEHDCYKLAPAPLLRNVSFSDIPDIQKFEHSHIFHTIDSDGRKQENCSAIGGHFHRMKVTHVPGGAPVVECVTGPMREVRRRVKGQFVKVVEPVPGEDDHRHDVVYLHSEKISLRSVNVEAVRVQQVDAQKTAPIPGVQ